MNNTVCKKCGTVKYNHKSCCSNKLDIFKKIMPYMLIGDLLVLREGTSSTVKDLDPSELNKDILEITSNILRKEFNNNELADSLDEFIQNNISDLNLPTKEVLNRFIKDNTL